MMRDEKICAEIWWGNLLENVNFEDRERDGRIIFS
jgi:hypothetical protein